jgi:hypothetical protein
MLYQERALNYNQTPDYCIFTQALFLFNSDILLSVLCFMFIVDVVTLCGCLNVVTLCGYLNVVTLCGCLNVVTLCECLNVVTLSFNLKFTLS